MQNNIPQPPTGLFVEVFKCSYGDCSSGGLSSRWDTLKDTDESSSYATIQIVSWYGYYKAIPRGISVVPSFGGCFVYSSDSRWTEKYPHPIKLFDRFE